MFVLLYTVSLRSSAHVPLSFFLTLNMLCALNRNLFLGNSFYLLRWYLSQLLVIGYSIVFIASFQCLTSRLIIHHHHLRDIYSLKLFDLFVRLTNIALFNVHALFHFFIIIRTRCSLGATFVVVVSYQLPPPFFLLPHEL